MIFGGTIAVTCYAPISYISSVVMLLMQGVSDGSQPLISLAYGEGKYHIPKRCGIWRIGLLWRCGYLRCHPFLLRATRHDLFGTSETVAVRVAQILPIFIVGFVFVSVSRVTTAYF